ncbi:MAG: phytanoyl-CoA dioxygenase family protein [Chitinophagales bacterium]|nr:phytanoyl-CoA dioxygenase family protein [Chitinophagales bacterium]
MDTGRQTFVNPEHETQFCRQGYVVVTIKNGQLLNELETIYRAHAPAITDGLQLSLKETNSETIMQLHRLSLQAAQPMLNSLLHRHKVIASGYINKLPGKPNTAGLHRDPSFTNETLHHTLLFWCPLVDTNPFNGAIGIVPGSHQIWCGYKGMVYGKYDFSYQEQPIIDRYSKTIELKKGEAIIFNTALLHFSGQNQTGTDRPVYSAFLIPSEAKPLCRHLNTEKNTLDTYLATEELLLNYYRQYISQTELPFKLLSREAFVPPVKIGLAEFEAALKATDTFTGNLLKRFRLLLSGK